ncbi:hypothetical protein N431DRAFT_453493 [Stipitochalara longipes BDJ]|nr:hypothetical protein N431DRAFT_453493 [Stipitochalara longipes BDJ]
MSGNDIPLREWRQPHPQQRSITPPLPDRRYPRNWFLGWASRRIFSVYRRIFTAVLAINVAVRAVFFYTYLKEYRSLTAEMKLQYLPPLVDISTIAAANMLAAILIRQDYIINTLFRLCLLVPRRWPLRIRCMLAKVYEYGGFHSGAAVCSLLWFIAFIAILIWRLVIARAIDAPLLAYTSAVILTLSAIICLAYPSCRSRKHDRFKYSHRLGNLAFMFLIFPMLILFNNALGYLGIPTSHKPLLVRLPAFWIFIVTVLHILLPWLRLRRLKVTTERHLDHAISLHFSESVKYCRVYHIAEAPYKDWHPFASIPDADRKGGTLIVSKMGDWTTRTINNPKPYYWTRGIPTMGVLCVAELFSKVLIVMTGSAIGPCLGTMLNLDVGSCRVVWLANNPEKTFGTRIHRLVRDVDPRATIINSRTEGGARDLLDVAWEVYLEDMSALPKAVFCVSNQKMTKKVVCDFESRGVPAFGPVWDS